jgi:hypothetical protein
MENTAGRHAEAEAETTTIAAIHWEGAASSSSKESTRAFSNPDRRRALVKCIA